jgi:DNA-binding transcriptional LysR family regulator
LDDANAIASAAIAGAGIAWAPLWLVSSALRAGALVPLLADWAGEDLSMFLVRRDGPMPDRVNRVMSFLKANRSSCD